MLDRNIRSLRTKDVRPFVQLLLRTGYVTFAHADNVIKAVAAEIAKEQEATCGVCKGTKQNIDEDDKVQPGVCPFCQRDEDEKLDLLEELLSITEESKYRLAPLEHEKGEPARREIAATNRKTWERISARVADLRDGEDV